MPYESRYARMASRDSGLVRRGVVGYAWEQLVEDYRLCAV
jgi:hypothetical protein